MSDRTVRERWRRGGEDWVAGVQWLLTDSAERVVAAVRTRTGAGPGAGGRDGAGGTAARALRVSDDERARVVDALAQACAEGRIDDAELADRAGRAWGARTAGELVDLVADLPEHLRTAPAAAAVEQTLSAVFREVRRDGEWEVPARLRVAVTGGRAVLDLTSARVRAPEVVLDLAVAGGTVAVRVPAGVPVTVAEQLTVYGSWDNRAAPAAGMPPAGTTRVHLTGTVVGGRVAVTVAPGRRRRRT